MVCEREGNESVTGQWCSYFEMCGPALCGFRLETNNLGDKVENGHCSAVSGGLYRKSYIP